MSEPYHDLVIEADAVVTTGSANAAVTAKTADATVVAKTADGELGAYGDGDPDYAWWRDAAQRPIRDASGSAIRVRIA
jgi:hypothetical protein